MSLATTNLSRLKACEKLAGGKAAGRRPRSASRFVTALKGRENLSHKVAQGMPGAPMFATLKRRERRAPAPAVAPASWSAPAERSGDGAFVRTERQRTIEGIRPHESGVALRFPPQSKIAPEGLEAVGKQSAFWCAGLVPVEASQGQSKQNFDKKIGAVVSGTLSGCNDLRGVYRGYRFAQPPANFWQPFGLQADLIQFKAN